MDAEFKAQNALLSILRGKNGKWRLIMTYCPPNCPNRALHCHSRCQKFLKARLMYELTARKAEQKEAAAQAFREDVRARVLLKHIKTPKKYKTKESR